MPVLLGNVIFFFSAKTKSVNGIQLTREERYEGKDYFSKADNCHV